MLYRYSVWLFVLRPPAIFWITARKFRRRLDCTFHIQRRQSIRGSAARTGCSRSVYHETREKRETGNHPACTCMGPQPSFHRGDERVPGNVRPSVYLVLCLPAHDQFIGSVLNHRRMRHAAVSKGQHLISSVIAYSCDGVRGSEVYSKTVHLFSA
jgi:hypothetical protein